MLSVAGKRVFPSQASRVKQKVQDVHSRRSSNNCVAIHQDTMAEPAPETPTAPAGDIANIVKDEKPNEAEDVVMEDADPSAEVKSGKGGVTTEDYNIMRGLVEHLTNYKDEK